MADGSVQTGIPSEGSERKIQGRVHDGEQAQRKFGPEREEDSGLYELLDAMEAVRSGNLAVRVRAGGGIYGELAASFNSMVTMIGSLASEVSRVAKEVGTEGKLDSQAKVEGVAGSWREVVDTLNALINTLGGQIRNVAEVVTAVYQGDFTKKVTVPAAGEVKAAADSSLVVEEISHIAKELRVVDSLEPVHEHIHSDVDKIIAFVKAGNLEGAKDYLENNTDKSIDEIRTTLLKLDEHLDTEQTHTAKIIEDTIHNADAAAAATGRILLVGIITAVLLALGMGIFVSRSIAKPLKALRDAATEIAGGNMETKIDTSGKDEIGQLAQAFEKMRVSLKVVMEEYKKKMK